MTTRGRALRFTAVSALVVLTLTGFSTGRGHGSGGDGGGGGGCSSSSQNHGSSHDYDDDDDYGSGGGGGGNSTPSLQDATVELVSCATRTKPYATVEVTNLNTREGTFTVNVDFLNAADDSLDSAHTDVTVPAGATTTAKLNLDASYLAELDHCEADAEAYPATK